MSSPPQAWGQALRDAATAWRLRALGPSPGTIRLADRVIGGDLHLGDNQFALGSATTDGRRDPETLLQRRYHPRRPHRLGALPQTGPPAAERVDAALYGGPLFDQFGHFLLESCARLWAARDHPDLPILLCADTARGASGLLPWQADLLDLLGLSSRIRLVTAPVHVTDLWVPTPGYEIQYRFARHHARFMARVPWRPTQGRKLWVSRRALSAEEQPGQAALDAMLQRDGWEIFVPEQARVADQLAAYASAERIAGEQGSALHALILLSGCRGLRLDMFARDPERTGHSVNANQATICKRKGIRLRTHVMQGETVLERHGPQVRKTYLPPDLYLARLLEK